MRKELEMMVALQNIDGEILLVRKRIGETPAKVKTVEQPLFDARSKHEAEKKAYEEFLKKKRSKEQQVDDMTEKINKLRTRTTEIKTNKEYQAHLKEIERFEAEKFRVEDELLELMERADDMARRMRAAEAAEAEEEKKIEEYARVLKDETAELESVLATVRAEREKIVSALDAGVYEAYMRRLETGQGLAVAEVKDSVCNGCHMNIPPQLYVEVRKGEEIYDCPQCGRYLFFRDEKDDASGGGGS